MTKKPRFFDLDDQIARQELASEFVTRRGGTITGALLVQSGIIRTGDSGSRMEMDSRGLRGYDLTGTAIFNFDTATGTLTVTGGIVAGGTITGAVITGGTLQTATSGKRVVIANPPGDSVQFFSGDADETTEGSLVISVSGAGGGRAGVLSLTTPRISTQDAAAIAMTSESKDGSTSKTVIALSADTILPVATTTNADSTIQLLGDIALQNSFSDPPTGTAGFVRMWNTGGSGLRANNSVLSGPLWPIRLYTLTGTDLVLSTTITDVPSITQTFTTYVPNAIAVVCGTVGCSNTTAGTGFCNGYINCSQAGTNDIVCSFEDRVHFESGPIGIAYTLATPGSFTIKLRGNKNNAAGAASISGSNSRMTILVIG